ncbi:hypothetical protein MN116_004079 [Schistosoma mekongi]|uniref:mitogen-activated protein kinase kinase n=1 Tax=Schistosoma mekongi TaxID=38744 RepID=A0AAE2D641_SCHME|nr:hypothetical protein MN116_004079 [Schistosoma mekongi]
MPVSNVGVPCLQPVRECVLFPLGLKEEAKILLGSENITIHAKDLRKVVHLGSGYYGRVEKMIHTPSSHVFAVKHISVHLNYLSRPLISRELAVGTRCNHRSVVTCYCGLFCDGDVLIVMELMDTSLDKLLKKVYNRGCIFPADVLAYIVLSVVEALEYLHRLEVIHRDVKPSNMLADCHGRVKVCDFGISADLENSIALTNIGTRAYLAPERINTRENEGFCIRSDVWSLGLSVLELATGKPCYPQSQNVFQQLVQVVHEPSPRLPESSNYPNSLSKFIDSCLMKNKEDRPNYVQLLESEFLSTVDAKSGQDSFRVFLIDYLDNKQQW